MSTKVRKKKMSDNWKNCILNKNNNMKKVIETLDKAALGIVLIEDEKNKFYGTITDGDVRRAILDNMNLNTPLENFIQKKPISSYQSANKIDIIRLMEVNGINQIPILNNNNNIVGLEILKNLLVSKKKDNPVFIMAGGFGKRLQPLTNYIPKPMLKIDGTPILEVILTQFSNSGFYNFYISTYYKSQIIKDYFKNGEKLNVSIKYIEEEKPLGTAGALSLLPYNTFSSPIIMMNGDLVTKLDINNLLSYHHENNNDLTIGATKYEFQVPYGVIETNGYNIKSIVEKPKHRFFINAGIYVIEPKIITTLDLDKPIDMPVWINQILDNKNNINIFPIYEYWVDIGDKSQYEKVKLQKR